MGQADDGGNPAGRIRPRSVMPGSMPGIHVLGHHRFQDVDDRDIGELSNAVLRTAIPGHDDDDYHLLASFTTSFAKLSRRPMVRLKTGRSDVESRSRTK